MMNFELFSILSIDKQQAQNVTQHKNDANSAKNGPKLLLEAYCQQKGYDAPEYSCTLSRFKRFEGRVRVEGVEYSTRPIEYDQKLKAENAAASLALESIKEFPITGDSSEKIARKIYECIGDNGIFLKYVRNVFE